MTQNKRPLSFVWIFYPFITLSHSETLMLQLVNGNHKLSEQLCLWQVPCSSLAIDNTSQHKSLFMLQCFTSFCECAVFRETLCTAIACFYWLLTCLTKHLLKHGTRSYRVLECTILRQLLGDNLLESCSITALIWQMRTDSTSSCCRY